MEAALAEEVNPCFPAGSTGDGLTGAVEPARAAGALHHQTTIQLGLTAVAVDVHHLLLGGARLTSSHDTWKGGELTLPGARHQVRSHRGLDVVAGGRVNTSAEGGGHSKGKQTTVCTALLLLDIWPLHGHLVLAGVQEPGQLLLQLGGRLPTVDKSRTLSQSQGDS